uniref:Uncharacterized protein n=1 Tax=Quercus lobata TaxID=97700 RepID=A0A7N2LKE1_QUELO
MNSQGERNFFYRPFYINEEPYSVWQPEESLASTERRVAEHGSCTLNIDTSSESRSILEPLLPPEVEGSDMSLPSEVEGNDMSAKSWRINLEDYFPALTESRDAEHGSCTLCRLLRTPICKQCKVYDYYKKLERQLEGYTEMETMLERDLENPAEVGTTDFLTSDVKSIDLEMTKSVALHQSSMDLPKSKVEILLHVFSKSMNSLLFTTLYHISSRPLITWKERRRNGFKKQRYRDSAQIGWSFM